VRRAARVKGSSSVAPAGVENSTFAAAGLCHKDGLFGFQLLGIDGAE
jgi:hypothetical protein